MSDRIADRNSSVFGRFPSLIMQVQEQPYWTIHRRSLDPQTMPPFMRDGDAMFVTREGAIILECILAESFAREVRESGEVHPQLWNASYVPLKLRTSNSMAAMMHFQRAQQNAEWRSRKKRATESVAADALAIIGSDDRLGEAALLLCVTITKECLFKALFTGKASLSPWYDGVNFLLPLTREHYGHGLEVRLHEVNIISIDS
jgi:hypothetical protein